MALIGQSSAKAQVESGILRILGIAALKRSELLPDVPTLDKAGVPGFEMSAWYMVFAPRKTPPEVIEKLNVAINKAITDPALVKQMTEMGVTFVGGSQAQADQFLKSEISRWGTVIKAANIKAD